MTESVGAQIVLVWVVRGFAAALAVLGSAATLGLAYRVFELVRG